MHQQVAYWLSTLFPTQLEMRKVDGSRVAYGQWGEGNLAFTYDLHELDSGLTLADDADTSVRVELVTRTSGPAELAVGAVTRAAARLKEMAGAVAAQPGVLLPDLALPGTTMTSGLLIAPRFWDGQTPHLSQEGMMIVPLELVMLLDDEYEIARERGVEGLERRLRRRGTDDSDWQRD
ncbi:suppressor of fused domain protein [Corynebacterium guangdongense]|uniref:Suppressor of fused-like domain-containing protein n=1 Tax=Corynebacterium guangdongense TaxID=1783348 RepID=A0ABU2A100_9CORY|nr:suppressor of fused domain protein [Corynebacterium guangdongense]MDR7330775.1 hypothetical protein [Corynebacterium guangdongense]WJZ16790.1 Suppressor of fused protein (SUFU) [Corynebacterium guangdongense]